MNTSIDPKDLPLPLPRWITLWADRGVPRRILEDLGLHLLQEPTSENELRAVMQLLDRVIELQKEQPDLKFEQNLKRAAATKAKKTSTTSPADLEERGRQQAKKVSECRNNHPLLKLDASIPNKGRLRSGLREALERLIQYRADPRRKNTDKASAEVWIQLLGTFDGAGRESLINFCKGSRLNVRFLLDAIIGVPHKRNGLLDLLAELFRDGSSERIRAVHDQAWLKANGKRLPKLRGSVKAADIAAGLQIPASALKEEASDSKQSEPRQTRAPKKREETLEKSNESEVASERAKWLSIKARKRMPGRGPS